MGSWSLSTALGLKLDVHYGKLTAMFFQGAVKTLLIAAAMSSVLAFLPDGAAAQESYPNCELVQNLFEQIECFSSLAVEKKDMAVCDGALHEGVRYQCYAVFAEKLGRW